MTCDKLLSTFISHIFWANFGLPEVSYGYHLRTLCHRVLWKSEKKNKDPPTISWCSIGLIYIWHNLYSITSVLEYHFYIILLKYLKMTSWHSFSFYLNSEIHFVSWGKPLREIEVCVCSYTYLYVGTYTDMYSCTSTHFRALRLIMETSTLESQLFLMPRLDAHKLCDFGKVILFLSPV